MKVKLYTSKVTPSNFVAEKDVPSFVTGPPDMIVWGNRTFKPAREPYTESLSGEGDAVDYVECFTHVIVD